MDFQNLQTGFKGSNWKHEIDVRDFIQANYEPYNGDESFLTGPTSKTTKKHNHKISALACVAIVMASAATIFTSSFCASGVIAPTNSCSGAITQ